MLSLCNFMEKSMKILYETKNFAICQKDVGIVSQSTTDKKGLADIFEAEYGYSATINRLDTMVGGCVLFAKNKSTANILTQMAEERQIDKEYILVCEGKLQEKSGVFEDLLFKDSCKNKSYVVKRERKGVKRASLEYEVIGEREEDGKKFSLVKVKLHTGRTHQIRVQFSSRKLPLCGDGKYGSKDNRCDVSLWSYKISFDIENENIKAVSLPPKDKYPWNLFNKELEIM